MSPYQLASQQLATTKYSNQKADFSAGKDNVAAAQLTAQDQQVANAVSFQAPGEKVYAVQFRQVKMSRWTKKDIGKAKLRKGVTWKVYFGGTRGHEAEDHDTIFAELEGKSEGEEGEEDEDQEGHMIDGVEFRVR